MKASVEDGSAVGETTVPASPLPPESAALAATARSKVIPFLDDEDAYEIRGLTEALEQADEANRQACHDQLKTALNRFPYLL